MTISTCRAWAEKLILEADSAERRRSDGYNTGKAGAAADHPRLHGQRPKTACGACRGKCSGPSCSWARRVSARRRSCPSWRRRSTSASSAYTMTHHTRQSALGLPVIVDRTAAGTAVPRDGIHHERDHRLRLRADGEDRPARRGSCSSTRSTASPRRSCPRFCRCCRTRPSASTRLPEGWLIAAAGNPPRYNQSARSFDMATLDRVRLHRAGAEPCRLAALRCRQRRASGRAELSAAAPGALFPLRARAPRQGSSPRPAAGRSFLRFCLTYEALGYRLHACADAAVSARAGGGRRLRRVL